MSDMTSNQDLRACLTERTRQLQEAGAALKRELFGIDPVIDQVIESVRAWYVLPQLITRPVIVCLWGLTGTGKTQLVRQLAKHLGFYDRFVEVQMDGFSHGASRYNASSVAGMLAQSNVAEGEPGILVLDEFQRYRTVDDGKDVKVERYQDVWALLSDGRLPPMLSLLGEIETSLASAAYDALDRDEEEEEKLRTRKLKLSPWEAREIKSTLKLKEPLAEIMTWMPEHVQERLRAFRDSAMSWETDYSRLLVFVCGNLDEMYDQMATRVEDCDTDADVFHTLTRKLSVIDVKKALTERFKPEQIARLGNNHVVYPSLSRAAYEQLIRTVCARYVEEIRASSGLCFTLGEEMHPRIYANAVFPTQGTRPLFSSIHAILSSTLVNAALWAFENGAAAGDTVALSMPDGEARIVAQANGLRKSFAVALELDRIKRRSSEDFRALLAVHEAGHGLAYAVLCGRAPLEIKINIASFEGGYNSYAPRKAWSRRDMLDSICITLAGRAAEELVFGADHSTSGAESDLRNATATAARFVRHLGFDTNLSRTDVTTDSNDNLNTSVEATNPAIESLLAGEYARAAKLLRTHREQLLEIVDTLLRDGAIAPEDFCALLDLPAPTEEEPLDSYAQRLAAFRTGPASAAEASLRKVLDNTRKVAHA